MLLTFSIHPHLLNVHEMRLGKGCSYCMRMHFGMCGPHVGSSCKLFLDFRSIATRKCAREICHMGENLHQTSIVQGLKPDRQRSAKAYRDNVFSGVTCTLLDCALRSITVSLSCTDLQFCTCSDCERNLTIALFVRPITGDPTAELIEKLLANTHKGKDK